MMKPRGVISSEPYARSARVITPSMTQALSLLICAAGRFPMVSIRIGLRPCDPRNGRHCGSARRNIEKHGVTGSWRLAPRQAHREHRRYPFARFYARHFDLRRNRCRSLVVFISCACAASDQAAATPPNSPMNLWHLIPPAGVDLGRCVSAQAQRSQTRRMPQKDRVA